MKKTNSTSTSKIDDKIYDNSSKKNPTMKIEPLQLNVGKDHSQSDRINDIRRDEAVNTINSTFRR